MTEPVKETLEEFMALGQRLREKNRFHLHRRSHLSGPFKVAATEAAARVLISAEAVPYRPNFGVYVIVEELADDKAFDVDLSQLIAVPGVAGAWAFGSGSRQITGLRRTAGNDRALAVGLVRRPSRRVDDLARDERGANFKCRR
jgi:hypothetical protein